jgi:hypothetical protein
VPPAAASPTLALNLVNSAGGTVAGNAVTAGSTVFAKAQVRDANGTPVVSKLVSFTSVGNVVSFQPASGQVLTDSTGVATVQVTPSSVSSAGADSIAATANVNGTAITSSLDVQTSPANVTLSGMTVAQNSLTAFQNTTASVNVAVNGQAATTPVNVGFTASCGSFSPVAANSDSTGKASSTFVASGCVGGIATLTATANGAAPVSTTVTVQTPLATNVEFLSATPSTIFTSAAASGAKQSTVVFKVVDAAGNPIGAASQVNVSLSGAAIAAGVTFADTGTTAPKILSTDANGQVSVIVKSGGFPTPVTVNATLVSNPAITAASAGLIVNSGRAVQNFFSISASQHSIDGLTRDGVTTTITVRAADRLAQPVPAGTPVSFIAEGGQIGPSCTLTLDVNNQSGCSVVLSSQEFRPANGRVTVLAFMDGEEVFVDANGNNRFDATETFFDMGQPFLDSNESGSLDIGEQKVGDPSLPGSGIGASACPPHAAQVANVANTCDGSWGPVRVRAQIVIAFSGNQAVPGLFSNLSATGVDVRLQDQNGNAMPAGTVVSATISGGTNCTLKEVIPATVRSNATTPTVHSVIWGKGSAPADTCSGARIAIKATTPGNDVSNLGSVTSP